MGSLTEILRNQCFINKYLEVINAFAVHNVS